MKPELEKLWWLTTMGLLEAEWICKIYRWEQSFDEFTETYHNNAQWAAKHIIEWRKEDKE